MKANELQRTIWIAAPRERVWQAVAEPDQLAQWFLPPALGAQMKRNDGGTLFVSMGPMDIPIAIVEVADSAWQLTIRSLPDNIVATSYTLAEEKDGTRVTVTMSGFEYLPGDAARERFEASGAGWEKALQNLKAHVEGAPLPYPEGYVTALFGYRRQYKEKLAVERSIWLAAPRERVWQAITDPRQIQQWFSPGTQWRLSALQIGGRLSVYNPETDGDMYVQVIEVFDPPHQFVTRSEPESSEPAYVTNWTLEDENGGTRLTLTHSGYELEAEDTRHGNMEQNAFGFGMMMENLRAHIEGATLPYPQGF